MGKMSTERQSVCGRFSFLWWSVCILLFRLASFRTTSRPLSRLRRWSGLRLPGCSGTFGHISRTCRSGAIDGRVRPFIGGDFADVLIACELLVQESNGSNAQMNTRGILKREMTDSRLRSSSVSWRFGSGG